MGVGTMSRVEGTFFPISFFLITKEKLNQI